MWVNLMMEKGGGRPGKGLWAYAYDVALPDREDRLQRIQDFLDQEHQEARDGARTWGGRVVVEPQVTRILVVSDSTAQDRDVNRRIEAELKRLDAIFDVTAPLAVAGDLTPRPMNGRPPTEPS
jgi:hypothetical protein